MLILLTVETENNRICHFKKAFYMNIKTNVAKELRI